MSCYNLLLSLSLVIAVLQLYFFLLVSQISHQHGQRYASTPLNQQPLLQLPLHAIALHYLEMLKNAVVGYNHWHLFDALKVLFQDLLVAFRRLVSELLQHSHLLALGHVQVTLPADHLTDLLD